MGLTVKDLFDIDIFKDFKLIAGEKGLGRPVKATEILDFEFVQGAGMSRDTDETSRFDALLSDVLAVMDIEPGNVRSGFSSIRHTDTELGKAVREAFWSCIVADLEETEQKHYQDLGIYRFIVPEINSDSMRQYMEEYLRPLLSDNIELLRTAKTYVLTGGELEETAARLYCHKNSVRYRLARMQEMLDPHTTEKEFFENLALAIRIYMLMGYR